jgi:hypothetical protein
MSGPSYIKIQKTGADEIGNGHGRCPLLILSVREHKLGYQVFLAKLFTKPSKSRFWLDRFPFGRSVNNTGV